LSGSDGRHLGLFAATTVGVGAIVGGGILALTGVAFATAGPGAILAFALNGGIAILTAASFAELAVRFPQSGGTQPSMLWGRRISGLRASLQPSIGVGRITALRVIQSV
jgi:hypothetical protein